MEPIPVETEEETFFPFVDNVLEDGKGDETEGYRATVLCTLCLKIKNDVEGRKESKLKLKHKSSIHFSMGYF